MWIISVSKIVRNFGRLDDAHICAETARSVVCVPASVNGNPLVCVIRTFSESENYVQSLCRILLTPMVSSNLLNKIMFGDFQYWMTEKQKLKWNTKSLPLTNLSFFSRHGEKIRMKCNTKWHSKHISIWVIHSMRKFLRMCVELRGIRDQIMLKMLTNSSKKFVSEQPLENVFTETHYFFDLKLHF